MRNFSKSILKYYPVVFLYGLLSNGNNNLLLCSYILNFYGDNNWLMGTQFNVLIFLSFIIIKLLLSKKELNNSYLNDYLILKYLFGYNNYKTIKNQLITNLTIFYNKILFFIYNFKNYNYFKLFFNNLNIWRPLFKKYSYFGYYRIHRSTWSSIRTEEFNSTNQLK